MIGVRLGQAHPPPRGGSARSHTALAKAERQWNSLVSADLKRLNISAIGARNDSPPKYFRKINLEFDIVGAIPKDRVERAIQLSFEKYCSVFHTLRQDIEIGYEVTLSIEEE